LGEGPGEERARGGGITCSAALLVTVLVTLLTAACGAEGTPAPYAAPPSARCDTLDERSETIREVLAFDELPGLQVIAERLANERNGALLERALAFALELIRFLPRKETTTFEFDLLGELIDATRSQVVAILDHLATGPDTRRDLLRLLSLAMTDCPRDSLILTVRDLFRATDLVASVGPVLGDPLVVSLLANVPDSEETGRPGFVALSRLLFNAVRSPNFDIADLRPLLGFLELDEPPLSALLDEAELYLVGDQLEHLQATLACFDGLEVDGRPGPDVVGDLLYDLVTIESLDTAGLLEAATPLIEQLQHPDIQLLGGALIDGLVDDLAFRETTIELLVFLLRDENVGLLLDSAVVLFESRAFDDLIHIIAGLTVRCPENE